MKNSLKLLWLLPFALLATGCAEGLDLPPETPNTPNNSGNHAPQPEPEIPNPPADPGDNDSPGNHDLPEIGIYQKPHYEKTSDQPQVERVPVCLDCIDEE